MSRIINPDQVPRDRSLAQELRSEINRNSAEISFNFWQEFELIRSAQRNRLAEEHLARERITTLMQDGQQEVNQEAEALSRSISAHGVTSTNLPSPSRAIADAAKSLVKSNLDQGVKNISNRSNPAVRRKTQKQKLLTIKTKSKPKPKTDDKPSPALSNIPRAPPTSRATMIAPNISNRVTPNTSQFRLAKKPKK
ncbi:uncharacterized protein LOC108105150 [Drosophila eugracilis]|uniref:uncharacterized protein LOC108105150 n=1 Tax=Drosophila eugracilis TaxID=29029 RepID=UPI001BDB2B74|nr:uncharacterized protein LOC108105150 [Drosophila eugracilis]